MELAHSTLFGHRLISPVDFGNVVSFDVFYRGIHSEPTRKGDREVVAEGAELAALVGKVIDEFAIFAIFSGENFFKLEDGAEGEIRRGLGREG